MAKKATATKAKKTTTKKPVRKTRKKVTKKKVNNKIMKLFVYNPDSEFDSNLEQVQLETKYRMDFVNRFGVTDIPSIGDFEHWKETLSSEVQVDQAV
ncbi:MAG: hypothetical protein SLAVMIC_00715 [uncultured marine phage]|uniref:Uncharacterized protein n=1 Tax=uncultured marine phage TaxID=707152 RepID=A0A8D9CEN6_9VIRU|nr:MAG: hypothetical protein SLAVMIC_00715 [uncultured marine phage]